MTPGGASGAGNLPWTRRELAAHPKVSKAAVSIAECRRSRQQGLSSERKVQGQTLSQVMCPQEPTTSPQRDPLTAHHLQGSRGFAGLKLCQAPCGHRGKQVAPGAHMPLLARWEGLCREGTAPQRLEMPALSRGGKESSSHGSERGGKGKAPTSHSRRRRRCASSGTCWWLGAAGGSGDGTVAAEWGRPRRRFLPASGAVPGRGDPSSSRSAPPAQQRMHTRAHKHHKKKSHFLFFSWPQAFRNLTLKISYFS